MRVSKKYILPYEECFQKPLYSFPRSLANGRTKDGKRCVKFGINQNSYEILIDEPAELTDDMWNILRNAGIMEEAVRITKRGIYKEFDPIRNSDDRPR